MHSSAIKKKGKSLHIQFKVSDPVVVAYFKNKIEELEQEAAEDERVIASTVYKEELITPFKERIANQQTTAA